VSNVTSIDWEALRGAARAVSRSAYAPYSHYPVGAAALCNVENASYGLTLCAECAVVSALHSSGSGGRLVALSCVDGNGDVLTPCGRCRQLLFEHGGGDMLIDHDGGPVTISYLLPGAFGPDHLKDVF
jgi:cytidine deaminase